MNRAVLRAGVLAGIVGLGALTLPLLAAVGVVTASTRLAQLDPSGADVGDVAGCLDRVLATIRTIESGGRYDLAPGAGGASGAYQFIGSTWRALADRAGESSGLWPEAWQAPADVQDRVAGAAVEAFLGAGNPVSAVPLYWFLPSALTDERLMDVVPMPEAGNTLTPRQYQARWVGELDRRGGCATTRGVPRGGVGNEPEPELAAWQNGELPQVVLVEVEPGRWLAPRTAAAFLAMRSAAARDGLVVRITSAYRSRADQERIVGQVGLIAEGGLGAPVGDSPHGLGVAVDVDVAGEPGLYRWLVTNAWRWCLGNYLGAELRSRAPTGGTVEPWHWSLNVQCTPEP